MITINQVQKEIDEIRSSGLEARKQRDPLLSSAERKKIIRSEKKDGNHMMFLQQVKYYLQTNPSEEFIKNQLKSLENKLDLINDNYFKWFNADDRNKILKNPKQTYNTIMETKKILAQIKTLKYIIG